MEFLSFFCNEFTRIPFLWKRLGVSPFPVWKVPKVKQYAKTFKVVRFENFKKSCTGICRHFVIKTERENVTQTFKVVSLENLSKCTNPVYVFVDLFLLSKLKEKMWHKPYHNNCKTKFWIFGHDYLWMIVYVWKKMKNVLCQFNNVKIRVLWPSTIFVLKLWFCHINNTTRTGIETKNKYC